MKLLFLYIQTIAVALGLLLLLLLQDRIQIKRDSFGVAYIFGLIPLPPVSFQCLTSGCTSLIPFASEVRTTSPFTSSLSRIAHEPLSKPHLLLISMVMANRPQS